MKKIISLVLAVAILITIPIITCAATYVYDYYYHMNHPVDVNFYIDPQKTDNFEFKSFKLIVNWELGLNSDDSTKDESISALKDVFSCIKEARIDTAYDKSVSEGYGRKGTVSFVLDSKEWISFPKNAPFLTMKVLSGKDEFNVSQNIEFYIDGEFKGKDGVDYSHQGIITTSVNNITETIGLEFKTLNVVGLDNTETETAENTEPTQPSINTEPTTDKPIELVTTETQPTVTEPDTPSVKPIVKKKANTVKVTVNNKTVKAKKFKRKKQTVKPLAIKKAKGKVTVTKIKNGTTVSIYKKITVNRKTGAITFKKGKYAKKTYKIKLKITAAGNAEYKAKTVTKIVKIIVK